MTRITDYTALANPAAGDELVIVDVSDTSMSAQGTTKNITVQDLLGFIPVGPSGDTTGVADSAAITAALGACPCVVLQPGDWYLSEPIQLATAQQGLICSPATIINAGSSWTPVRGPLVEITAGYCEVSDAQYAGLGATSATQCGGVGVYGAQHCRVGKVTATNMSWYAFESVGSATVANHDLMFGDVIARNCAAAVRIIGNAGTAYQAENFLSNIQVQQLGATSGFLPNADGILIQDCEDVVIASVNGGVSAGNGSIIHYTGAVATCGIVNIDVGSPATSTQPAVWITASGGNTPEDIWILGGSIEGGLTGFQCDAGSSVRLGQVRAHRAGTDGFQVNGTSTVFLSQCLGADNNQSAGTGYDFNTSGITTGGNCHLDECRSLSDVGVATAGEVTNPFAVTSGTYVNNCRALGSTATAANMFTGTPEIVRSSPPFNPRGSVFTPAIGPSPYTAPGSQSDLDIFFSAANGGTGISIGGNALSAQAAGAIFAGAPLRLPARQSITITWSGTAPTWQWYAE